MLSVLQTCRNAILQAIHSGVQSCSNDKLELDRFLPAAERAQGRDDHFSSVSASGMEAHMSSMEKFKDEKIFLFYAFHPNVLEKLVASLTLLLPLHSTQKIMYC